MDAVNELFRQGLEIHVADATFTVEGPGTISNEGVYEAPEDAARWAVLASPAASRAVALLHMSRVQTRW